MSESMRQTIKNSFMHLLEEKSINKITVKEIVQSCGINRNSFYYYFEDIPSLAMEISMDWAEELISNHPDITNIDNLLDEGIKQLLGKKKIVLHLYASERCIFEVYLMKICNHISLDLIEAVAQERSIKEADKLLIAELVADFAYGLISDWLGKGMDYDIIDKYHQLLGIIRSEEHIDFLNRFIQHTVDKMS